MCACVYPWLCCCLHWQSSLPPLSTASAARFIVCTTITHAHTHAQSCERRGNNVHGTRSHYGMVFHLVRWLPMRVTSVCSCVRCVATTNKTNWLLCLSQSCLVFRCGSLSLSKATLNSKNIQIIDFESHARDNRHRRCLRENKSDFVNFE